MRTSETQDWTITKAATVAAVQAQDLLRELDGADAVASCVARPVDETDQRVVLFLHEGRAAVETNGNSVWGDLTVLTDGAARVDFDDQDVEPVTLQGVPSGLVM